jgi:hypothetical protein
MSKNNTAANVRWVMHVSDRGHLLNLGEPADCGAIPAQDEVITRPFLVDPSSRAPVPVRVVQRLEWHHGKAPTLVLVVSRE